MNFDWFDNRKKTVVSAAVLLFVMTSLVLYFTQHRPQNEPEPVFSDYPLGAEATDVDRIEIEEERLIFVDLKGAVLQQGVYELPENSRVIDAIEMAGGFSDDAEKRAINLAERLRDGQMIYVPAVGETPEEQLVIAPLMESSARSPLVSINRADEKELTQLPGIGPARAASIVAFREERGRFQRKEDLMNVSGIGQKTFDRLKDLIIVD